MAESPAARDAWITHVDVSGFRGLRDVRLKAESPFTVIAGPNNSGKSTFVAALDFVGNVFRVGLEQAVSFAGGFERICDVHGMSETREITFELGIEIPRRAFSRVAGIEDSAGEIGRALLVTLRFSLAALPHATDTIDSDGLGDYWVESEEFVTAIDRGDGRPPLKLLSYRRVADGGDSVNVRLGSARRGGDPRYRSAASAIAPIIVDREEPGTDVARLQQRILDNAKDQTSRTTLFFEQFAPMSYTSWKLDSVGQGIRTFHFNVDECRRDSSATPTAVLGNHGEHLAAVVRQLRTTSLSDWSRATDFVATLLPGLEEVRCVVSTARMLALQFDLDDGRCWGSTDVSDGTILGVALVAALLDPHATLVVLDEPEVGLHPWVVRELVAFCDGLNERQAFIATHSPVVLGEADPRRVVIAGLDGEGYCELTPLLVLDPDAERLISEGVTDVASLIDTGAVRPAVPVIAR